MAWRIQTCWKKKHQEAIPDLTKEWIIKGNEILDEKYHESWIIAKENNQIQFGLNCSDEFLISENLY